VGESSTLRSLSTAQTGAALLRQGLDEQVDIHTRRLAPRQAYNFEAPRSTREREDLRLWLDDDADLTLCIEELFGKFRHRSRIDTVEFIRMLRVVIEWQLIG
jgi:hypothetical protein